ncbi:hypothetical protein ABPG74_010280 [Tetrahymena malaccensis]
MNNVQSYMVIFKTLIAQRKLQKTKNNLSINLKTQDLKLTSNIYFNEFNESLESIEELSKYLKIDTISQICKRNLENTYEYFKAMIREYITDNPPVLDLH